MEHLNTKKFIEGEFDKEVIPALMEYIKIDNLSPNYDPEWNTNGKQEKAAQHCLDWVLNQGIKGLKGEVVQDEGKTPLIFVEIDANGSDSNIMIYGHFDKQPHFHGWAEGLGPTTPVIRGEFLYGRGGADDGYAIFAAITAIKAVQTFGGKHGRIVIIIEGSEESSSVDLMYYINKLKQRIGDIELMFCLDSGCKDYEALWITTSLRGCVNIDLTIKVVEQSVHSGVGSGVAPDSFMIFRSLLDRLEDSKTGIVTSALHVDIPKKRYQEAEELVKYKQKEIVSEVIMREGGKHVSDDYLQLYLNNTWRPTVVVTGQTGLPPHNLAGNVLRSQTSFRVSVRLPPTLNTKDAEKILCDILTQNPPFNAEITIDHIAGGNGWNSNEFSERLEGSLLQSSKAIFGNNYYCLGMGGSIPFINQLSEIYPKCELVVMGVLGPLSNAHAANEALHLRYCKEITTVLAHTLNDY